MAGGSSELLVIPVFNDSDAGVCKLHPPFCNHLRLQHSAQFVQVNVVRTSEFPLPSVTMIVSNHESTPPPVSSAVFLGAVSRKLPA